MNTLPRHKKKLILKCLVEGNSIRATSRLAEVSKNTVTKLLIDAGTSCAAYQDEHLRDLPCRRIEVDEIWSFIYAKARNVPRAKSAPRGSRGRLDVDGDLRAHEDRPVMADRRPNRCDGNRVHGRPARQIV